MAEVASKATPRDAASMSVDIDALMVEDANQTEASSKASHWDIDAVVKTTLSKKATSLVPDDAPAEDIPNETAPVECIFGQLTRIRNEHKSR